MLVFVNLLCYFQCNFFLQLQRKCKEFPWCEYPGTPQGGISRHFQYFRKKYKLLPVHPCGPSSLPFGQMLHLAPDTRGLQTHLPVICSQSSLTEPNTLHWQAKNHENKTQIESRSILHCLTEKAVSFIVLRVTESCKSVSTNKIKGWKSPRLQLALNWIKLTRRENRASGLTSASCVAVSNARQTPVSGFTAITPAPADSGFARALQGARVTRRTVRSQRVALTHACSQHNTAHQEDIIHVHGFAASFLCF